MDCEAGEDEDQVLNADLTKHDENDKEMKKPSEEEDFVVESLLERVIVHKKQDVTAPVAPAPIVAPAPKHH